jgi:small subunit ribosomal protein S4
VTVDGKKVDIGSYRVKPGQVVEVKEKSRNMALVLEAQQSSERDVPDYLEQGDRGFSIRYVRVPELSDVPYPVKMEPNLVVEYYSS